MLKILVDAHVFDEGYYQGTTSYIRGMYKDNIGLDITFAAYDAGKLKDIFGDDAKVVKLYFKSSIGRLLLDFPRLFLTGNYDYVHFQYIISPFLKNHSIVTIHDVLFKDYKNYFSGSNWIVKDMLYRISYLMSRYVLTVSEYSEERLRHHYGSRDITVTENMFDLKTSSRLNPGVKHKFVLFVSRDEERKRFDLIEELVQQNKGLHFVVVTNSTRFVDCANVTSFSSLEQPYLNWLFSNCHFSVFPSMCEGFGMPIIESLISGRLVLTRRASAMATLKIPTNCFFDNDQEFKIKVLKFWNRSFDENRVEYDLYSDWALSQEKLIKKLKS
jgi:glycosyltransferase involved in cell wall biosynthesis